MIKYLKTTLIFFVVWLIASVLNGLLSGATIAFFERSAKSPDMEEFLFSIVFSFLFSIPFVGITWFVTIVSQLNGSTGDSLFQFVLSTTLCLSIAAALFFVFTIGTGFMNTRYFVALSIIVSAFTSVLTVRKHIKANA